MSAAGSGSDVSVSIAGNASSLQAAISQTTAALNTLSAAINQTVGPSGNAAAAAQNQAAALNNVSAAANQAAAATNQQSAAQNNAAAATNQQSAAIQQAIAAYNNSTAAINYVQSATATLGAAQAQANIAWANGASSADDYRQRLALLQAQLQNVQAAQDAANGSSGAGIQQMMNLGSSIGGLNQNLIGTVLNFGDFDEILGGAAGPIGLVIGLVSSLGSTVMDAFGSGIDLTVEFAEHLGTDLVDAANAAYEALEPLVEQTFQLADATEKNYFNWAFIWGGVNQQTGLGPGQPIANELLQWSKKASLQMPFTRQDLLQAITTLSVMGGQSPSTVETDLSLLSDIASTQGRPGLTLSWAAMAALRGGEGYSRMLLMDLNISKTALEKFGYNEKDPSSFFPALKLYEQSRGEYGASAYTSQNTFWGASTSLTDRLQNFGLAVAGWNDNPQTLTDDVFKNSLFGGLKGDLLDLNKELDALNNSGVLPHIASLFSQTLGGGVNDARVALTSFADALGASGVYDFLFGTQNKSPNSNKKGSKGAHGEETGSAGLFGDLANFANSSQVQGFLHDVGDVVGSVIGPAMKDAAQGAEAFMTALGNTGIGSDIMLRLSQVAQWLADPATQEGIKAFATAFASIVGTGAQDVLMAAQNFLQGVTGTGAGGTALDSIQGVAQWLADPGHQAQIRQAAWMIGTDLAAGFQLAVAGAKSLIDALGGVITLLGDLANLMLDQATGNWTKEAQDAAKFWGDVHNINTTLFSDFQNLTVAATNAAKAFNQAPLGAAGAAGGNSPPIGSKAWQDHMAKVLAAGGLDGNGSGPQAMTSAFTSAANQGGQQFAQAYLASAQNEFAKQQNGSQLVNALVGGLQQQIVSGGDALGQALYAVIDSHTRAVVTQMMRNYDLFGNADMRQPGGYSIGTTMGYK